MSVCNYNLVAIYFVQKEKKTVEPTFRPSFVLVVYSFCLYMCGCRNVCLFVFSAPTTKCQLRAAQQARECGGFGCPSTTCNDDGTFPSMQCSGSSGYCHCQDEDGYKILETDFGPGDEIKDCDAERGQWLTRTKFLFRFAPCIFIVFML